VALELNTKHVEQGQELPIYDLRQPLFLKVLASYLTEVQALETALWDLYIGTMLPNAKGDALDMIGALVGQAREGRTDASYILWIQSRITVLRSSGRPRDIYAAVLPLLPAGSTARLIEYGDASFTVTFSATLTAAQARSLGDLLRQAKAAAVRFDGVWSPSPSTLWFRYGTAAAPTLDATRGFGDVTQTTGGRLVGIV
jgi:hypothetical protein